MEVKNALIRMALLLQVILKLMKAFKIQLKKIMIKSKITHIITVMEDQNAAILMILKYKKMQLKKGIVMPMRMKICMESSCIS